MSDIASRNLHNHKSSAVKFLSEGFPPVDEAVLTEFLLQLEEEIASRDNRIHELEQTIRQLQKDLRNIQSKQETEESGFLSRIERMSQEVLEIKRTYEVQLIEATEDIMSRESRINSLTTALSALQAELDSIRQRSTQAEKCVRDMSSCEIAKLKATLEDLRQQLDSEKSDAKQLSVHFEASLEKTSALSQKLGKQSQLLNYALAREKSSEAQIERMHFEISKVSQERSIAIQELSTIRDEVGASIRAIEGSMMCRFTQYESQISSLRTEKSEVEVLNHGLQAELENIAMRISEVARMEEQKRIELRLATTQQLELERNSSLKHVSEKEAEIESISHRIHLAEVERDETRRRLRDLESRFNDKQSLLQIKEGVIEDLTSRLEALKRKLEPDDTVVKMREELSTVKTEVRVKEDVIRDLQHDMKGKDEMVAFISREVEEIKLSYDSKLEDARNTLQTQHACEIQELRDQLKEAAHALISMEQQLSKTFAVNAGLEHKLEVLFTEMNVKQRKLSAVMHAIQDDN